LNIDDIKKKLEEDLKWAEKATPAPWEYTEDNDVDDWSLYNPITDEYIKQDDSGVPISIDNGVFIAHSRNTYEAKTRALLIAVEKLKFFSEDFTWSRVMADADHVGFMKGSPILRKLYGQQAKDALEQIAKELGLAKEETK